ncbi:MULTISPECIES: EAL domain-containing protein [unclassified Pseudomonas]|uniref:EAL domain-containing response regulator n=1 Tax=unclassified Pseudomonas TaxID=196821 RepID=UPI0011AA09E0|nr:MULTISPECIES: EAL domain-containing response regulator [unclassified Pseudomonas]
MDELTVFSLRILILEDHPFQRSVAVNLLRQIDDCEILEAGSGAEALSLLKRTGRVDLLLCDLCMDDVDGLELLRIISLSDMVGQVIICSSLPDELRRTAVQIGALLGFDVLGELPKPIVLDQLRLLVEEAGKQESTSTLARPSLIDIPSEADVRQGLRNNEFVACYQPKVDLMNGAVTGFEILARWRHPSGEVLSPISFMSVLERCGLLDVLFFQLFEQGLRFRRACLSKGMPVCLAFNLHADQLDGARLVPQIKTTLRCWGLSGHGISFEITESGLLRPSVTSLENLLRLRMLGCGLAIDDFGTGFSTMQRLCQLPFTELKIDKAFVRDLDSQPRYKAAIKSTQMLAHSLGMSLVVEGIETVKQHQQVVAMGCTQGQGYFYARPMMAGCALKWMSSSQLNLPLRATPCLTGPASP